MANVPALLKVLRAAAPTLSRVSPTLSSRLLGRMFTTPMRHRTPAREQRWLVGASEERLPFDEGRSLRMHRWGSGPTVLLVHGWSGRGSQLGAFAAPLVQRGFRVVTFDAPGHGEHGRGRTALPELVDAVERVASHVGPLHAVVAHSLGTSAATIAMARGLRSKRLVFLSPPDNPPAFLGRMAHRIGFSPAVARGAQRRLEARYGMRFDDARAAPLAQRMKAPLLIVHDRDDDDVPHAEGRALAAHWPGARLVTTEGLGHRRIVRDPEVVSLAADFVADLAPSVAPRLQATA